MEVTKTIPIFASSRRMYWLSGQNPEVAGLLRDTASGVRHHDPCSILKKTFRKGWFKNKRHLSWIKENGIYNIRLGNRAGSVDENKECINNASILVLYSNRKKSAVSVFRITSHCTMTEAEMKAKGYPNKKVGKRYMTFNIVEEAGMVELIKNHSLVEKLIESYPEHVSGAPVFL